MTTEKKNRKKRPTVKIDKSLDEFNNRVMFPKKLLLLVEAATITCLYRTHIDCLFL